MRYYLLFLITFIIICCSSANSQQSGSFNLALDSHFLSGTNIPQGWYPYIDKSCIIHIYYPRGYVQGKSYSLLVVFGPMGNNMVMMVNFRDFADQLGFVIIAPQPQTGDYDFVPDYYYTLASINHLKKYHVITKFSKIILAGHSGGAKMALCVAALGGLDNFSGVLAIDTNQDLASEGYNYLHNSSALELPIVILNATDDQIVTRAHTEKVLQSLQSTGFKNVFTQTHTGGHRIPYQETCEGLKFLLKK